MDAELDEKNIYDKVNTCEEPWVLIESYLNKTQSLGQYSLFTLIKTGTDTWSLGGNLT